jgi:hypothetical protein
MPFMFGIIAFLLGYVLWAFFHYQPRGVNRTYLLAFNLAAVVLALPLSYVAAMWIYSGAAEVPEKQRLAAYLAIMAGGAAYLALVSLAGLIRNLFLFPLSRRAGPPEDHHIV